MNTTHPLLPDYTGPTEGWCTFLHHDRPVEYDDHMREWRDYVMANTRPHEQRVRALACQVIPAALIPAALTTAWTIFDAATTALTTARTAYNTAETAFDTARTAYVRARTALDTATTALDTATTALTTARTALTTATTALTTARTAYVRARTALTTARAALDAAWLCEHLPGTPWRTLYDEAARTLIFDAEIPEEAP